MASIRRIRTFRRILTIVTLLSASSFLTQAQQNTAGALARMPIKEVSVFKDGLAFVLHEGNMQTDATGNVVMDYLPAPILGTFWGYSATPNASATGMVAGQHRVVVARTDLKLIELLPSNIGG